MFIAIEGDNGTGKTTLSKFFRNLGFEIVSEIDEAKILETEAKKFLPGSLERHEAFIKYNSFCGEYTAKPGKFLIIRYWISTIAAAFADGLFDFRTSMNIAQSLSESMPKPDYIFRLLCDYQVRISRIAGRKNKNNGHLEDNISPDRDMKYKTFSDSLFNIICKCYNVHVIETASITPLQTFIEIAGVIDTKL